MFQLPFSPITEAGNVLLSSKTDKKKCIWKFLAEDYLLTLFPQSSHLIYVCVRQHPEHYLQKLEL